VRDRVVHQVRQNLAEPGFVTLDDERAAAGDQVDAAVRRHDPRVLHGVGGERQQVDRAEVQGPLLIQPGQLQQVLDQEPHAGGL
jgi:hypothetical protein